jgi:Domain of unknown function (DUF4158)
VTRELDQDELIDRWTLTGKEPELIATKRGAAKIGSALMLRFYIEKGRFPRGRSEIHDDAVEYVARQVGVDQTEIAFYDFTGRTSKAHRAQIRESLGFRECSVADADALTAWLVDNVTQAQRGVDAVRDHLLTRCRTEKIEPPTGGRVDRIVRSALSLGEGLLFERVSSRLTREVADRMFALIGDTDDNDGSTVFAEIRSDPGAVSLKTMLSEIAKLKAVRAIGLPDDVFADVSPKIVASWRGRASVESPSHLRRHAPEVVLTLLAALLHCRHRELTDTLVELLISTVHRINARAEVRVTNQLIKEFKRVTGKENLLFKLAEATVDAGAGARHGVPGRSAAGVA